jgi:hypothetical protein
MSNSPILPEKCTTVEMENEIWKLLWKPAVRQTFFANERFRSGKEYFGLQQTLSKPHGLQKLMEKMIELIVGEKFKSWKPILNRLLKLFNQYEIEDALEILLVSGIITIKEKNTRPSRGEFFQIQKVTIDDRAFGEVKKLYPIRNVSGFHLDWLNELQGLMVNWEYSNDPICQDLERIIEKGLVKLKNPDLEKGFPIHPKSFIKFKSVLHTLVYCRSILAEGKSLPLRTISSMVWEDTKVLDRYRNDLKKLTGRSLKDIGITTIPDTIWIYGAAYYKLEGMNVSLFSGKPFILSENTIRSSEFHPFLDLQSILIVENLTNFNSVLDQTYYSRTDVLIIWSNGFWNSQHKRILEQILDKKNVPIYVWNDIDGGGLSIARLIIKWGTSRNISVTPILMDVNDFILARSDRNASEYDLLMVNDPIINSMFPQVCKLISENKTIVEQERLLTFYNYVEKNLP